MRVVPGWVVGAAGTAVVVSAFVLGGRLAAADVTPGGVTPATTMVGSAAPTEYVQRATYLQPAVVRRTAAPVPTYVQRASTARAPVAVKKRSTRKSVAIIAGSAAAGAVIGGVTKGKKGAVIGGIVGGAAATIWDQVTRRRSGPDR